MKKTNLQILLIMALTVCLVMVNGLKIQSHNMNSHDE